MQFLTRFQRLRQASFRSWAAVAFPSPGRILKHMRDTHARFPRASHALTHTHTHTRLSAKKVELVDLVELKLSILHPLRPGPGEKKLPTASIHMEASALGQRGTSLSSSGHLHELVMFVSLNWCHDMSWCVTQGYHTASQCPVWHLLDMHTPRSFDHRLGCLSFKMSEASGAFEWLSVPTSPAI